MPRRRSTSKKVVKSPRKSDRLKAKRKKLCTPKKVQKAQALKTLCSSSAGVSARIAKMKKRKCTEKNKTEARRIIALCHEKAIKKRTKRKAAKRTTKRKAAKRTTKRKAAKRTTKQNPKAAKRTTKQNPKAAKPNLTYAELRAQNILLNEELLKEIGLGSNNKLKAQKRKAKRRKRKRVVNSEPTRKSTRQTEIKRRRSRERSILCTSKNINEAKLVNQNCILERPRSKRSSARLAKMCTKKNIEKSQEVLKKCESYL